MVSNGDDHASADVSLASVDKDTAAAVGSFFVSRAWGTYAESTKLLRLSDPGLFIVERCPAFGVCLSYRPMLGMLAEAAFGNTADVFRYRGGHELWVDRQLNVIGSGMQPT